MLYPKNQKPFDEKLFADPTSEYRGAPFWAWNCQMTEDKVTLIVDALKKMGMGGGHIHCRTGMNNPYMGEEFLHLVEDANQKFKDRQMITWLYDEDRWPSGAGGGLVTKDEQYRIRFLVFAPWRLEGKNPLNSNLTSSGSAVRSENRRLLAHYQVKLTADGWLSDYQQIDPDAQPQEGYEEWFAYLEISGDNPWFNNQSYVNTLDKKAIQRFIEVTHEKYYENLGEEFGKSIPAIFTDEPQFCHKTRLNYAADRMEVIIPYTDDFEDTFRAAYGHGILESLPELFWEKGEDQVSVIRYQYHDHICERFASAFADTIGEWCENHGLMLTGHMMEEPTLKSQTAALGEAMRSYRSFQLPGIDMLCDWRELTTAKQAQSASRQFGRPGVLSELYGVTNWDFDFRGHKLQGDWQAALGVTVRVHHLTWTSMAGEAKRDYPACIGYQSPWYKEYPYVENYFARINTLLTRGKADVRIGVIHPIESYWLHWGSEEKTGAIREEMDTNFQKLTDWLLYGFLDFDFISESLLPDQNQPEDIQGAVFPVGSMAYETIVVPNCETLRSSTLERLKAFKAQGGTIIFTGDTPKYLDAIPSSQVAEFAASCICVPFTRGSLLGALKEQRTVDVRDDKGLRAENLIYQLRQDQEEKIFFLAHVNKMKNPDLPRKEALTITLDGCWDVICYEPLDGTSTSWPCVHEHGKTVIHRDMYDHDSLLLRLIPADTAVSDSPSHDSAAVAEISASVIKTDGRVPVTLSEPNVMVLDQAEYAFDDGPWQEKEELLRIDNKFRQILGYPLRMEAFAQPWVDQEEEKAEHVLRLKFVFESLEEIPEVKLALENTTAAITFNGKKVSLENTGWYTDEDIVCRDLGSVRKGSNELLVEIPYRRKENVENLFLLGDFGVETAGGDAWITGPVRSLAFGDITRQGLAFYGGNVEYQIPVNVQEDGELTIHASQFRAPLLTVRLDDEAEKQIAYSPYSAVLPIKKGSHILRLTAFGNRVNTFGTLHNCNYVEAWCGPNAWRTEGDQWAYEYQLKPTGVLKAPKLTFKPKNV